MSTTSGRDRLRSLDGLRGVAALVVLVSHVVTASVGSLSAAWQFNTDLSGEGHWLLRTPLAVCWAGQEFVIVFFVLSGFVLSRALLLHRPAWSEFYLRRAVRLYLPAWLSLIGAALLMASITPAHVIGGVGFWLDTATPRVGLADAARQAVLVLPRPNAPGGPLNGVLWSLQWEVLFSAALPMMLLAAGPLRRLAAPVAVASLLCVWWGSQGMAYLAPFMLGLLLALHEPHIRTCRDHLDGRGPAAFVALTAVLLSADLWLPGAQRAQGAGGTLVALGAVAAVLAPMFYESIARPLQHRFAQWLGSRSFSLYLIHLPIVLAFANGLHAPSLPVLAALAIPTSLLAAEAFFRVVERPSHHLARAAATGLRVRSSRPPEPQLA